MLPRFDSTLSLLCRLLRFLDGIRLVRRVGVSATQDWCYVKRAVRGHSGTTQVDMGVRAATKAQSKAANLWLEQRKALISEEPDQVV